MQQTTQRSDNLFQKRIRALPRPQTVMIGTGAGKVEGLTETGKFGGSSVIFSTALSRP